MTMQDLLDRLAAQNPSLYDPVGPNLITLETYEAGCFQAVGKDTFVGFFGAIMDDPNITNKYQALCDEDASSNRGYRRFFDTWNTLGIFT